MGTIYRNGVPFVGSGGAGGVEMTEAEYELLPESEKMNGAIYFITDGDVSYPSASQMRYDNTESQIPATTVQGAIDENRIEINTLKNGLIDYVDVSATIGDQQYGTFYYVNVGIPTVAQGKYISVTVIEQQANRFASVQAVNNTTARVYCDAPQTTVKIRIAYRRA